MATDCWLLVLSNILLSRNCLLSLYEFNSELTLAKPMRCDPNIRQERLATAYGSLECVYYFLNFDRIQIRIVFRRHDNTTFGRRLASKH